MSQTKHETQCGLPAARSENDLHCYSNVRNKTFLSWSGHLIELLNTHNMLFLQMLITNLSIVSWQLPPTIRLSVFAMALDWKATPWHLALPVGMRTYLIVL